MVAAHHAHHAQRVICTHLVLTPTPSLPLLAVSLFMCRQSSAAVMPCGSNCIHWRCWWLPLPSHLLLPLLSLFYFSIAASSGVCVCAGGEGEGDACFTQPHHRPLATNSRLVAACLCWWLRGGGCVTVRVAAPPLPLPLLCCVVCWCHHATWCSHPAATTTTRVMASWPNCLSSSLPSL